MAETRSSCCSWMPVASVTMFRSTARADLVLVESCTVAREEVSAEADGYRWCSAPKRTVPFRNNRRPAPINGRPNDSHIHRQSFGPPAQESCAWGHRLSMVRRALNYASRDEGCPMTLLRDVGTPDRPCVDTFAGPADSSSARMQTALLKLAAGGMIVLCDDTERPTRGELVFAASGSTTALVAFAVRRGSGFLQVALPGPRCDQLGLAPQCGADCPWPCESPHWWPAVGPH
jgi:3,4-dihydroxy-2-butanone 4-phosphate synthase